MPKTNEVEKAPQKKNATSTGKGGKVQASAPAPAPVGGKGKKSAETSAEVPADAQQKKPSKYAGVEKGTAPNLATAFAGLHLNVETVKKWLKNYYDDYKVERKQKTVTPTQTPVPTEKAPTKKGTKAQETTVQPSTDTKPKVVSEKVMLNNANFALGAVEHSLCLGLVGLVYEKSKKGGAGLYTLSEQDLMTALDANRDYSYTFGRLMFGYFPKQDYVTQLGFDKRDLVAYVEQYGFTGGNASVNIGGVVNLIAFLMLQNRTLLAETAYWSTIAKKGTTVSDRSILCAIPVVYQGQLKDTLFKKCEDVMLKISGVNPNEDSESGSKQGSKKGSKKTATVVESNTEEDDVDDEVADDEEGDDDAEEEQDDDEEPEPEPEPVKPVKKPAAPAKKPLNSAKK